MIVGLLFYISVAVYIGCVGYTIYLLKTVCYENSDMYTYRFILFKMLKFVLAIVGLFVGAIVTLYAGLYQPYIIGKTVYVIVHKTIHFTYLIGICGIGVTIIRWLIFECRDIYQSYKIENGE